jgi:hypothetical protein
MSRKEQVIKDCDRCASRKAATDTVRFAYDGNTYEIDVCEQHAAMLDRDMRGWTRLARELEQPKSAFGLSDIERDQLRRRSCPPAVTPRQTKIVLPEPEVSAFDDVDEALEMTLWPTDGAISAMETTGVSWPKVVDAVRHPEVVIPSDREDVQVYYTRDLKILLTEDHHVIGLTTRDPGEALPDQKTGPQKRIVRKGKRGGVGNIGPRTHEDLLEAIRRTPGWTLEYGGKHYKVLGPDGQTSTLPITPSDYRGTLNAVAQLRALGLDLREAARSRQSA